MTSKDEALRTYDRAVASGDVWALADAAKDLADALRTKAPARRAKNRRRGLRSRSYPGVRLPVFQKQACGHSFNSAMSAICIQCPKPKGPRICEGAGHAIALRDRLIREGVGLERV